MRYRALDANGDMTWGNNLGNFLIDNSAAVIQAIRTRLNLWAGQWYLDQTAGVPYLTDVFGKLTEESAAQAIKSAIRGTQGVTALVNYIQDLNHTTRKLQVSATVNTSFTGQQNIVVPITLAWPQVAVTDGGVIVLTDTGKTVFATVPPQGPPSTVVPVPT